MSIDFDCVVTVCPFNIHDENPQNRDTTLLSCVLAIYELIQHGRGKGNSLDLIISRGGTFHNILVVDVALCDLSCVFFETPPILCLSQ